MACSIGDITLEATSDELVATGVATFGRIDSVVANAGIGFYGGLLDYEPDQVRLMIDVNVLGTVGLARAG